MCFLSHPSMDSPGKAEKALDEVWPFSPSHPHIIPGEEVKDLLLAAGNGGQSFHNGTGCLPCRLRCWSKEHLQGMRGKPGSDDSLSPGPQQGSQLPSIPRSRLGTFQEKVKGKNHPLTWYLTARLGKSLLRRLCLHGHFFHQVIWEYT